MLAYQHRIEGLCYRSHDLDEIYENLPKLQERLNRLGAGRVGRSTTQVDRAGQGMWMLLDQPPEPAGIDFGTIAAL